MSAGEESEMSGQATNARKDVIELLLHEHTDDMDAEWRAALRSAARDLQLLARLRSHEDFEAMLEELEDTATRHGSEVDGLLLQLLRGDQGGRDG